MDRGDSFTIGRVTGVHGLNGKLKVWSFAQSLETFRPETPVLLQSDDGHGKAYTIVQALPHKKGVLLTLEGVDTRELAENLVGLEILIDRDQLPEPEPDTWYWQDLLGLDVEDHGRGCIGKITDIFPTGANDVLVVTGETGEILVPMHRNFVASVDMEKKILFTTLPGEY
jgi:16S rRNA processing protein RimM